MKKLFVFLLTLLLIIGSMAGCGQSAPLDTSENDNPEQTNSGQKIVIAWSANFMSHEYYQRVRMGMEQAADKYGFEFISADANDDSGKQISDCENLMTQNITGLIISPVDSNALSNVIKMANEKNIFVVTESNYVDGVSTLVAIDNKLSGMACGDWAGKELLNRGVKGKVLILGYPSYEDCRTLAEGFKDALKATGAEYDLIDIDGGGFKEAALEKATDALTANPDINVIFGINDDSTLGGVQAYINSGKDIKNLISITNGIEGDAACMAMMEDETLTAGNAVFPELVGQTCVEALFKEIQGESLPEFYPSITAIVTKDNLMEYYTKVGNEYNLNYDAVQ